MSTCYNSWKVAKTGENIPCYIDGKPSASLYNPVREAEQFAEQIESGFTVIVGYTSGLHIEKAREKFPENKIVVVEKDEDTINFLCKSNMVNIPIDITLCTVNEIECTLLQSYLPVLDGNFSLVPVRSWVDANKDIFESIKRIVNSTLERISSDISVQAHFGKLWHRNILKNLSMCEKAKNDTLIDVSKSSFPISKAAFVAGAGPSLDEHIDKLKRNRKDYFIIATDTAFHALSEQNITSDVVVSVDAQYISQYHYMCEKNADTLFAFDLCANPIAVTHLVERGNKVCFFKSEHPLCSFIDAWYMRDGKASFFPTISSTGGTVTLAALNFAALVGFNNIITAGCDFGYLHGKMYGKGIYMDSIFNSRSCKINTCENEYLSIMYRTPLITTGHIKTTKLLQVYKKAYEAFFTERTSFDNVSASENKIDYHYKKAFPSNDFLSHYINSLQNGFKEENTSYDNSLLATLLPYVAWYNAKNFEQIGIKNFFEIGINATIHFFR